MRTTSEELKRFYATPTGQRAERFIVSKLVDAWGDLKGQRLVSFGFGAAILPSFPAVERAVNFAPASAGTFAGSQEVLVEEHQWPLRDQSVDRLVIFHGLEEAPDPKRLMREAWRVLTDDGRLIIVAANRHGFWTLIENSPFAAGRAYSERQLMALLGDSFFAPTARAATLYWPPIRQALPLSAWWERTAERLEPLRVPLPNIAGVVMVEARRSMAAPVSGSKAEALAPVFAPGRGRGLAAERDSRRAG